MSLRTLKGTVACKPTDRDFKPEKKVNSGFATMEQITALVKLEVVLHSESGYEPEDNIYVKADVFDQNKLSFANKVYTIDSEKVILVPEECIVLTNRLKEGTK